jgi:hypothetical protein
VERFLRSSDSGQDTILCLEKFGDLLHSSVCFSVLLTLSKSKQFLTFATDFSIITASLGSVILVKLASDFVYLFILNFLIAVCNMIMQIFKQFSVIRDKLLAIITTWTEYCLADGRKDDLIYDFDILSKNERMPLLSN